MSVMNTTNKSTNVKELVSPPSIHIGFSSHMGALYVEIIGARGLVPKPGSKELRASYVKASLFEGKKRVATKKTKPAKGVREPGYQQVLMFRCNFTGKMLQVVIWGKYGRVFYNEFMGAAQILLVDADLNNTHKAWYKLSPTMAACEPQVPLCSPMLFPKGGSSALTNASKTSTASRIFSPRLVPPNTVHDDSDITDDEGDFV